MGAESKDAKKACYRVLCTEEPFNSLEEWRLVCLDFVPPVGIELDQRAFALPDYHSHYALRSFARRRIPTPSNPTSSHPGASRRLRRSGSAMTETA